MLACIAIFPSEKNLFHHGALGEIARGNPRMY
jgi:hypothetical protein